MIDPTYTAALHRLSSFAPKAGRDYAAKRNYDDMAHVSVLSPYIRHRIITEQDVLRVTLARHSPAAAEKFVQEVYWRTYWKGWLEMRPDIWTNYKAARHTELNRAQTDTDLQIAWDAACAGRTGIDCFDHWAKELVQTGYLHNHARMWFASIWIFTLRLPWALGADFFLRHLLDGDPASNTLSWRWVAGLQTVGKTYLARPDNIEKYTNGRFHPSGLANDAPPLHHTPHPPARPIAVSDTIDPNLRSGLLLTQEDLSPGWLLNQITPVASAILHDPQNRSTQPTSPLVDQFISGAMQDCATRFAQKLGPISAITPDSIAAWITENAIQQVITSYPPVGPTADTLAGHNIKRIIRPYDNQTWPHATHGFFKFKKHIPTFINQINDQPSS